jgi:hypothetical protein
MVLLPSRRLLLLWPQRFPIRKCLNGSAVPLCSSVSIPFVLDFEVAGIAGVIQGQGHGTFIQINRGGADHERIERIVTTVVVAQFEIIHNRFYRIAHFISTYSNLSSSPQTTPYLYPQRSPGVVSHLTHSSTLLSTTDALYYHWQLACTHTW